MARTIRLGDQPDLKSVTALETALRGFDRALIAGFSSCLLVQGNRAGVALLGLTGGTITAW